MINSKEEIFVVNDIVYQTLLKDAPEMKIIQKDGDNYTCVWKQNGKEQKEIFYFNQITKKKTSDWIYRMPESRF